MKILQRIKIVINYILGAVPVGLFGTCQTIMFLNQKGYLCNFNKETLLIIFILYGLSVIGMYAALHIAIKNGIKE